MRTTLNTTYSKIQSNLAQVTNEMSKINERISSGKEMSKISDNPVNLVTALRYRTTIAELDQFSENIGFGGTVITASETALTQIKELALRAKTLAIQAIDPALSENDIKSIATEIRNLFDQTVQLSNTQVNGKYIFGGYRTTGYTDIEPEPFMADKGDGYWINGTTVSPLNTTLTGSAVATVASAPADLAASDLVINGYDIGIVDLTVGGAPADVNGINMAGANALVTAINTQAGITTYSNVAATADTNNGIDSTFQFDLNNTTINVTIPDSTVAAGVGGVADLAVTAINAQTASTGVTATLGGANDTVVFENSQTGDLSTIRVSNFTTVQNGGAALGFTDFAKEIVSASLTTQIAGAVSAGSTLNDVVDFNINGHRINYTAAGGVAAVAAQEAVDQINLHSAKTGITALLGNDGNGGVANSVVLQNSQAGDASAITITNLTGATEMAITGLADGTSSAADATHNTGQISLTSGAAINIATSATDDTILTRIGLGGGGLGNSDDAADGQLAYGYPLDTGALEINGTAVSPPVSDGLSTVFSNASAAAKATAINALTSQTGVTATVDPVALTASAAVEAGTEATRLTGVVTNTNILANTLAINGTTLTTQISTGATTEGLNMQKAFNARTEINTITPTTGVTARLTTQLSTIAITGTSQPVSFTLNGSAVSTTTGGVSANDTATDIVNAVNAVSSSTGVTALVGDGTNGGVVDSIILRNTVKGNENSIELANISVGAGSESELMGGLVDGSTQVGVNNNTGEISFDSASAFTITSPSTSPASDIIINELGLSSTTGTGEISSGATPGYLDTGDLTINGVDIFTTPTAILQNDSSFSLIDGINAKTSQTGITATIGVNGTLLLSASDGRNMHIATSANGESITHLNGGSQDKVYMGSVKLSSDRKFSLQSSLGASPNLYESGLAAIGMSGGSAVTGESTDTASDGKINVFSIHNQTGSVRYTGDRANDLEVKIGKTSTMAVSENGKTVLMDNNVFSTFKALENYLLGTTYSTVTGNIKATDTSVNINSKTTGLEPADLLPTENLFSDGSFSVVITDNDFDPSQTSGLSITVNTATDTLQTITSRINGIPNISASWTSDGYLKIQSDNPSRYTIALGNDTTNFLKATGVNPEAMQSQALSSSLDDIDTLMAKLTEQISDFGARENRIQIQSNIYSSMLISSKENLSEAQDTDMIKAIMDLKSKEVAYQAALSAASKTMQLSLVDYL